MIQKISLGLVVRKALEGWPLIALAFSVSAWGASQYFVTVADLNTRDYYSEVQDLDKEINFYRTKKRFGEATLAEQDYLDQLGERKKSLQRVNPHDYKRGAGGF